MKDKPWGEKEVWFPATKANIILLVFMSVAVGIVIGACIAIL